MKYYDRIFASIYSLSKRTNLNGQPDLMSAWIMLSGFEYVNLITVFFLTVLVGGHSFIVPRAMFLAPILLILIFNAIYIGRRGAKAVPDGMMANERSPHRWALAYCVVSCLGLLVVMVAMAAQAALK